MPARAPRAWRRRARRWPSVAELVGCPVEQVLVSSTGVIGVHLPVDKVVNGAAAAFAALSRNGHTAARGIMTTDTGPKEFAVQVETPAGTFRVGGIAKGAGHDRADDGDHAGVRDDRCGGGAGAAGPRARAK